MAYTNGSKTLPLRLQRIVWIWDEIPSIDDEEIVECPIQFSEVVKSDSKGSGVLLILDELGRMQWKKLLTKSMAGIIININDNVNHKVNNAGCQTQVGGGAVYPGLPGVADVLPFRGNASVF